MTEIHQRNAEATQCSCGFTVDPSLCWNDRLNDIIEHYREFSWLAVSDEAIDAALGDNVLIWQWIRRDWDSANIALRPPKRFASLKELDEWAQDRRAELQTLCSFPLLITLDKADYESSASYDGDDNG